MAISAVGAEFGSEALRGRTKRIVSQVGVALGRARARVPSKRPTISRLRPLETAKGSAQGPGGKKQIARATTSTNVDVRERRRAVGMAGGREGDVAEVRPAMLVAALNGRHREDGRQYRSLKRHLFPDPNQPRRSRLISRSRGSEPAFPERWRCSARRALRERKAGTWLSVHKTSAPASDRSELAFGAPPTWIASVHGDPPLPRPDLGRFTNLPSQSVP